jgi:hypothetical protein
MGANNSRLPVDLNHFIRVVGDTGSVPVIATEGAIPMKQYLLSVYQPDGAPPAGVDLATIGRNV